MTKTPKIKIKELLCLEPGKIYVLKYQDGILSPATLSSLSESFRIERLHVIPLPIQGNISQVKFETKENEP